MQIFFLAHFLMLQELILFQPCFLCLSWHPNSAPEFSRGFYYVCCQSKNILSHDFFLKGGQESVLQHGDSDLWRNGKFPCSSRWQVLLLWWYVPSDASRSASRVWSFRIASSANASQVKKLVMTNDYCPRGRSVTRDQTLPHYIVWTEEKSQLLPSSLLLYCIIVVLFLIYLKHSFPALHFSQLLLPSPQDSFLCLPSERNRPSRVIKKIQHKKIPEH